MSASDDRSSDHLEAGERSRLVPEKQAITGDLGVGVDFISSVIAGLLLGLGLDWIFDTSPVLVVIGIVAGFVSGFLKLWRQSAVLEKQGVRRTAWEPGESADD